MITETLIGNVGRAMREDPESRLAIRYATFASLIEIGDEQLLVRARDGELSFVKDPTTDEPWDFAVRGAKAAWETYRRSPTPTSNHPLSMAYQGHMSISGKTPNLFRFEGNYQKLFANIAPLCAILEQFRRARA